MKKKAQKVFQFTPGRVLAIALAIALFYAGHPLVSSAQQPETGVKWDAPMQVPSPEDTSSWFPDLAVDSQGHVHLVWNETNHISMNYASAEKKVPPEELEKVFASVWDGQKWLPFNDIVPSQRDIIRQAIAIDSQDRVHFVYGWFQAYYQQAPASEALSAAGWSSPKLVNSRQATYMKDIATYEDRIHFIYDDRGAEDGECPNCADIFYRHSTDNGLTWSSPAVLAPTGAGSSRAQLEVDRAGTLYVTWDEGWDRLSGNGVPQHSIYIHSQDGGNTWASPVIVSYPTQGNSHLTVGADGQGGVMLVWRNESADHYYFMWSTDYGATWSPPKNIPGIFAETYNRFNLYDMATDSAGHIHLLITGYMTIEQEVTHLYHFEWDGKSWSAPLPLYEGNWHAQNPHLVVDRGNQLHAAWYIREDIFEDQTPHQVWYVHGQSSALAEAPVKVEPTATPLPTATPAPTLAPTPVPTLDPGITQAALPTGVSASLYTETDELLVLLQSLLPAALIVIIVITVARFWRR